MTPSCRRMLFFRVVRSVAAHGLTEALTQKRWNDKPMKLLRTPISLTGPTPLAAIAVLLLAAGCEAKVDRADPPALQELRARMSDDAAILDERLTIGDLEQGVWLQLDIAESFKPELTQYEDFEEYRGRTTNVAAAIRGPWPEGALPLEYVLEPRRNFETMPAVLRSTLELALDFDDAQDSAAAPVIEAGSHAIAFAEGRTLESESPVTFDLMEYRDEIGSAKVIFARVRVEGLLMPPGTDVALINPETATTRPDWFTIMYSNAVRIERLADANQQPIAPPTDAETQAQEPPSLAEPPVQ